MQSVAAQSIFMKFGHVFGMTRYCFFGRDKNCWHSSGSRALSGSFPRWSAVQLGLQYQWQAGPPTDQQTALAQGQG